jgi:predicted kinase
MSRAILALAGLPGTGKSLLAAALSQRLGAPLFDKDRIRFELFGPDRIEYSRAQDDACCRTMHERTEQAFASGTSLVVFDGRTYSKHYQIDDLEDFAARVDADLFVIECTADAETVRRRLESDQRAGLHPAGNRTYALYLALRAAAEPITRERLSIDTSVATLEQHAARCLEWVRSKRGH